jgi:hypothetical protein
VTNQEECDEAHGLEDSFRSRLERVRDFAGQLSGYHYRNTYDFVLREGQFFEPRPRPENVKPGRIRGCFRNSRRTLTKTGLRYVEGYAVPFDDTGCRYHAWNISLDGFVIDSTWEPVGRVYLGVVFPLSTVRVAGVPIIDNWEDGFPMLREPWKRI